MHDLSVAWALGEGCYCAPEVDGARVADVVWAGGVPVNVEEDCVGEVEEEEEEEEWEGEGFGEVHGGG